MNCYKYMFKELYYQTFFSRLYKYEKKMIKQLPKIINNVSYPCNNEYNILKKINDKNIIKINEVYEDTDYFYNVMDFYERGDLYFNINNKRLSIKDYKKLLKKIIEPIFIIHKLNIVHMDLKLENYVLDNNSNNFILIDFHLSKIHPYSYYKLEQLTNIVGTKPFIAPEIYDGYYCKSSDMYSLGCMLYLIYTRNTYSPNSNNSNNSNNFELLSNEPYELQTIIKELLSDNYKLRPSIYDLKYLLK